MIEGQLHHGALLGRQCLPSSMASSGAEESPAGSRGYLRNALRAMLWAMPKIHVDRREVKLNFVELFQITTITSSRTSSTTSLLPRSFQR